MASEEVIALDLPMEILRIRLAPHPLVVAGDIRTDRVFTPDIALAVNALAMPLVAHKFVITDDDDLFRCVLFAEHLVENLLVKFPLADASTVRGVAEMQERIDATHLEKPERIADVVERHRTVERLPVPLDHQMRVRQYSEYEIRLPALRLPFGGSREKSARQRQKPQRGQTTFRKLTPCQVHS